MKRLGLRPRVVSLDWSNRSDLVKIDLVLVDSLRSCINGNYCLSASNPDEACINFCIIRCLNIPLISKSRWLVSSE